MADIKIKLTKSLIGSKKDQIATANSLGLRKIGNVTVQPDNAQTQGKIKKISHLVRGGALMKLHELSPAEGSKKAVKRIGRGAGSGQGKTAGKGHKGQKARSGYSRRPGFEGGQMPLQRRIPKRGFNNIFATEYATVNVSALNDRFDDGATVDAESLVACGLVKKTLDGIKVLGKGEITKALTVKVNAVSESAKAKIEAAGGKVEVL